MFLCHVFGSINDVSCAFSVCTNSIQHMDCICT
uniref:Uncharacterized protein n=1 Tax=Arundo donax TaxID=35708 RepID=A0A0A8XTU9_ARUDO